MELGRVKQVKGGETECVGREKVAKVCGETGAGMGQWRMSVMGMAKVGGKAESPWQN